MPYKIEFEDQGQDLTRLTVDEKSGVITDAGLLSWLYANGNYTVDTSKLEDNRMVHHSRDNGPVNTFRYPMVRLELNGELLAEAH